MVALELECLIKAWPAMKIRVDLKVEPGSLLALAGPSGCGKSTVLRMIAGLCPPDSGKVMIDGKDVTALSPKNREVGMVFQDYALFPHLNVLLNVSYGLAVRGIPRKTREALSLDILDSVGMRAFSNRHPHELSGGERQRVALARTIATRPRVVLFDEPLSSLDSALRKNLRTEIREYQRRFGLTAIYVTHDLEEAMAMADKVAVMDNGSILQCSTPADLWRKPASEAVVRFLGSGPCLPILRFESSGREFIAITTTGRFPIQIDKVLPPSPLPLLWGQSNGQHGYNEANTTHFSALSPNVSSISANFPSACIFFERTHAKPLTSGEFGQSSIQDGYGFFSATCMRTEFAGDVVECLMEAGQKSITLRFAPENAPVPGEHVHFRVKSEALRVIQSV